MRFSDTAEKLLTGDLGKGFLDFSELLELEKTILKWSKYMEGLIDTVGA